jgi:hypothetical protein
MESSEEYEYIELAKGLFDKAAEYWYQALDREFSCRPVEIWGNQTKIKRAEPPPKFFKPY